MSKEQLEKRLARLESINDQLVTELSYIDTLMRQIGFSDGLNTVKASAIEIHENPEAYFGNEEN